MLFGFGELVDFARESIGQFLHFVQPETLVVLFGESDVPWWFGG